VSGPADGSQVRVTECFLFKLAEISMGGVDGAVSVQVGASAGDVGVGVIPPTSVFWVCCVLVAAKYEAFVVWNVQNTFATVQVAGAAIPSEVHEEPFVERTTFKVWPLSETPTKMLTVMLWLNLSSVFGIPHWRAPLAVCVLSNPVRLFVETSSAERSATSKFWLSDLVIVVPFGTITVLVPLI